MITHIARIANTPRAHDLGYGFFLTWVELRKKVDAQVIDEVGSSTIMGCGFDLIRGVILAMNRVCKHLFRLFLIPLPVSLLPQRLH